MKTRQLLVIVAFLVIAISSCKQKTQVADSKIINTTDSIKIDSTQVERDIFYTLMAYAVVYKDWQIKSTGDSSRGYNIGSVLVNKDNYVVNWERNSVNITKNKTQHGEVRLMQSYIERSKESSLPKYTIYTSLEPCAMCSGMMVMMSINKTVYGQTDPDFGKAIERLKFDSQKCGGYKPYPRAVISNKSPDSISLKIDKAYADYLTQTHDTSITKFLSTDSAKVLYEKATTIFLNFTPKYAVNNLFVDSAKRYFKSVSPAPKTKLKKIKK